MANDREEGLIDFQRSKISTCYDMCMLLRKNFEHLLSFGGNESCSQILLFLRNKNITVFHNNVHTCTIRIYTVYICGF